MFFKIIIKILMVIISISRVWVLICIILRINSSSVECCILIGNVVLSIFKDKVDSIF